MQGSGNEEEDNGVDYWWLVASERREGGVTAIRGTLGGSGFCATGFCAGLASWASLFLSSSGPVANEPETRGEEMGPIEG